ncbi:MAG: hypothetical protein C4523_18980 [Myxococcales bacterium]|nr:MAG: hypothetical protein C4523_18980 [Myxococcales bacterium]
MSLDELLQRRRTTRYFDPARRIDAERLERILDRVAYAPSGFNLQPWRILVVQNRAVKDRLCQAVYNPDRVRDASAVLVLCGDTTAWQEAEQVADDLAAKGYFPGEARSGLINLIRELYGDATRAREAVVRDLMAAAMVLMLAATEEGVDSAPLSSFDAKKLSGVMGLPAQVAPVLLLALGYARKPNPPRASRKARETYVCWDAWNLPLAQETAHKPKSS